MATRFEAANLEGIERTANLPDFDLPYTAMLWVYPTLIAGDNRTVFSIDMDDNANYDIAYITDASPDTWTLEASDSGVYTTDATGGTASINTWAHICIVRNAANNLQLYVNSVNTASVTQAMTRGAPTRMSIGIFTSSGYIPFDGRVFAVKIWNVALSAAEIAQEMNTILPRRLDGLIDFSPCFPGAAERLLDYSGNAYNWTAVGTLSDEDPPPVSWGASDYFSEVIAGGTVYTQAVAGATTPAGGLTKQGNKILAGASTPAGIAQRIALKFPSGASIPTGALNKLVSKSPAGASAPGGLLARLTNKIVSGATTPGGTSSRQTQKELSGASLPGGSLAKEVGKILSGASTPVGILATLKTVILALFGATTPTGTLTLDAAKGVQGNSTPAGDLTKEVRKNLDGASIPVGILATLKTVVLSLFGATTPVGILTRSVNKNLDGVTAPAGSLVKRVGKWLTGITTPIGSLIGTLIAAITGTSRVYLTLDVRQSLFTLESRSINLTFGLREALSLDMLSKLLTLDSRSINLALGLRGALSLDKRAGALSLATRSTNLTMAGR